MHRDQPMYSAEQFWEERYRQSERVWSGEPNSAVVAETAGLSPGRALDLGCGEGADAIWLAAHGWNVTGVDVSATAVERARLEAQRRSLDAVTGLGLMQGWVSPDSGSSWWPCVPPPSKRHATPGAARLGGRRLCPLRP